MKNLLKVYIILLLIVFNFACSKSDFEVPAQLEDEVVARLILKSTNLWELVWADEFDGNVIDSTKWNVLDSYWEKHWKCLYNPDQITVENGNLVISAIKDGEYYHTGKMTTESKFHIGLDTKVLIRLKMPEGAGLKTAFWMLGENKPTVGWPECGELDIIEQLGKDSIESIHNIHYYIESTNEKGGNSYSHVHSSSVHDEYHSMAIHRIDGKIIYYFDGMKINEYSLSEINTEMLNSMYMLLQLDIGKEALWTGPVDPNIVWPKKLVVDYIRVYERVLPLLIDGGFESTDFPGWKLDGVEWESLDYCDQLINILDKTNYPQAVYEGNKGVSLSGGNSILRQKFQVTPGQSYEYGFWAKKGNPDASLAFTIKDESLNNFLDPVEVGGINTWEFFSGTITIPNNMIEVYINFYKTVNETTCYIDSVYFNKI